MSDNLRRLADWLEGLADPHTYTDDICRKFQHAATIIRNNIAPRTTVSDGETKAYMTRWLLNSKHDAEITDLIDSNRVTYEAVKALYLKHHG